MITRAQLIVLGLLWLSDWSLGLWAILTAPERVPVHWNWQGEVDRYSSPWELGLLPPVIFTVTFVPLLIVPCIGSVRKTLERSGPMYGRVTIVVAATLIGIHAAMIFFADNDPAYILRMAYTALGLMFAILGHWMRNIRRNPVMGIRTPWTMKSDYVWERTHRVGGRLMLALGTAIAVSALLLPIWVGVVTLLVGLLGLCTWAMFYSRSLAREERRGNDFRPGDGFLI
jgi:uncharacterized membrane protein